jgi:enamine deaminase RidA (YjgF/YER057c/UK114 family)
MKPITRMDTGPRLSRVIKYGDFVFLSGVTSGGEGDDIRAQMRIVLEKLDGYLAKAGVDKTRLLTVEIWLRDIDRDFAGMNEVWEAWVPAGEPPTRASAEARLGNPKILVEVLATAAAA